MVSQDLALKLIEEIESMATVVMKAFNVNENQETQWIQRLVHEHPVFRDLPPHLQQALLETPASNIVPLGNRRTRKLWKKHGALVHLFSGENSGYTLRRAFHEVGGDKRLMLEMDFAAWKARGRLESFRQRLCSSSTTGTGWPLSWMDRWPTMQNEINASAPSNRRRVHAETIEVMG